jgi:hypothetical protein
MKVIVRLLILSIFLSLPLSYGCSKFAIAKRQENKRRKELVKQKQQEDLEAQAAYEAALDRHYDMQTKETRKAMRQNMKKSLAYKENKKPFFLVRWFTPKARKAKPKQKT